MRLAVIDLGTNSIRFDVQEINRNGQLRRLHREKLMVRLGQDVFLRGHLDKGAKDRTLQALIRFQLIAKKFKAEKIVAFATSALREASDRKGFIDCVKKSTGIEIRVITGKEEARLISLGVLANEKTNGGKFALLDMGGGSTEISICQNSRVLHAESFPLGTARLQQIFLSSSSPSKEAIEKLRRHIRSVLLPTMIAEEWPRVPKIIGSSGTVKAIGKIIRKTTGAKQIERQKLKMVVRKLSQMTTSQLLAVPGMEARRVDMILAGMILLEEAMHAVGAKKVIPTEYSLRDGIVYEELKLIRRNRTSLLQLHLDDILQIALRFGKEEMQLRKISALAGDIFDRLVSVHKLAQSWKIYLQAAALLKDVGEAIHVGRHEQHSAYIARHADYPVAEAWETEFIAQLCAQHEENKTVNPRELEFLTGPSRRKALMKITALLRVIDALDTHVAFHFKNFGISRIRIEKRKVSFQVKETPWAELQALRLEQKKHLFETIFKRRVIFTVRA